MKTFPTGSTIGILGGGQLARMTAMAAARLGYRCHIFCPAADEPALDVASAHTQGAFDDEASLARFADAVDVVTLEWENVPLATLDFLAKRKPVHPGSSVLRVAQDRVLEKTYARDQGVGTADFAVARSAEELADVLKNFKRPCLLKSTRMGYDGKGQVLITDGVEPSVAWKEMGSSEGIVEAFVEFSCEVSVLVARREDGLMAAYPAVENRHSHQILAETLAPATISHEVAMEAVALAQKMTEALGVVGLLAIEMFVLKHPNAAGQQVVMNEVAPRPHNSGHWTIDACACSQYEQLVRAVCGLPLGTTVPHSRAVMENLIGDDVKRVDELLADPSACLHLYGKKEVRKGRKMGHVTFLRGKW